ncbi:uncharacterized protein LOC125660281 isoform X3 [Ostrea edulis]|uniref:uncharacterized protein LOC125660281 isoform X3 n=1 Tax=Ostrea edulis TaxID=37623 RepID=UPI0024AF58F5|nr:uncharacterized protein LOC125660281 isoform X3 [Ostrea edulis]
MEYKLQSLESNDRIDHVRGTCQKCSQLHKRCFVFVCLLCALFAFINFLLLIYVVGRSDVEADILKQLHTLQARVQTLEAISSGSLSAVNEARHEFVDLADQKNYISSWNTSPEGREKRGAHKKNKNVNKKHNRKRKHKQCCKPKIDAVHIEGTGGESYPDFPRETLSGTFHKWEYAEWFFKLREKQRKKQFELDFGNGCLTVKQDGLYLLYSQITLKGNGTQGYHVMKNNEAILACYSNNMMLHDEDKTSCFTMGIFRINRNDTISIRHISTSGVRAVFTSNASFFGMIRLGRFTNSALIAV